MAVPPEMRHDSQSDIKVYCLYHSCCLVVFHRCHGCRIIVVSVARLVPIRKIRTLSKDNDDRYENGV